MTVMEEIRELVDRMMRAGIEIPPFVLLGCNTFNRLNREMNNNHRYTSSNPKIGYTAYCVHTTVGSLTIRLDPTLPNDFLSIGRMTLDDFRIEDIIFND